MHGKKERKVRWVICGESVTKAPASGRTPNAGATFTGSEQREAFGLPDLEISPRRHLIVSRQAGGWTLAAIAAGRMVGFVHHLAAVSANNEIFGYSHMMAVANDYQNKGVGARLKWAQRERALREGRTLIKWTWDPMQARNAHFNLNRLGVSVNS